MLITPGLKCTLTDIAARDEFRVLRGGPAGDMSASDSANADNANTKGHVSMNSVLKVRGSL
jgi:hypothetical protein